MSVDVRITLDLTGQAVESARQMISLLRKEGLINVIGPVSAQPTGGGIVGSVDLPAPVKRGRKPKQAAPEAAPTETANGPTKEDVRAALQGLAKATSHEAARALLKDVGGATTLGQLDEAKYRVVIAAANEAGAAA